MKKGTLNSRKIPGMLKNIFSILKIHAIVTSKKLPKQSFLFFQCKIHPKQETLFLWKIERMLFAFSIKMKM